MNSTLLLLIQKLRSRKVATLAFEGGHFISKRDKACTTKSSHVSLFLLYILVLWLRL